MIARPGLATAGSAAVALNPAGLDLGSFTPTQQRQLEELARVDAGRLTDYSLIELVRAGGPRMLIQHGTADEVEPIAGVRRFCAAMTRVGNDCTLIEYDGAGHGFHYPGSDCSRFDQVMAARTTFLLSDPRKPSSPDRSFA